MPTTITYVANAAYHSVLNAIGAQAAHSILRLASRPTFTLGHHRQRNSQKNSALTQFGRMAQPPSGPNQGELCGEMDRETMMNDFVEAVRQVDISEQQVADQRRIVDLLTEFGRDTTAARKALIALEQAHARNMGRRDQLRALLEE